MHFHCSSTVSGSPWQDITLFLIWPKRPSPAFPSSSYILPSYPTGLTTLVSCLFLQHAPSGPLQLLFTLQGAHFPQPDCLSPLGGHFRAACSGRPPWQPPNVWAHCWFFSLIACCSLPLWLSLHELDPVWSVSPSFWSESSLRPQHSLVYSASSNLWCLIWCPHITSHVQIFVE